MCEFCNEYNRLKIMETTLSQPFSREQRKIKSGLVLSVTTNIPEFENMQNFLRSVFELNFCPECGKDLRNV